MCFPSPVVDAAGKPPSGLLDFKLTWLGDWEECGAVVPVANYTDTGLPYRPFDTQYCTARFPIGRSQVTTTLCDICRSMW